MFPLQTGFRNQLLNCGTFHILLRVYNKRRSLNYVPQESQYMKIIKEYKLNKIVILNWYTHNA